MYLTLPKRTKQSTQPEEQKRSLVFLHQLPVIITGIMCDLWGIQFNNQACRAVFYLMSEAIVHVREAERQALKPCF